MAIQSNFRGNFAASGAKTAGPGRFGTIGLSGLSDFATHLDDKQKRLDAIALQKDDAK